MSARMRTELSTVKSFRDIKIGKEVHARAGACEKVAFRKEIQCSVYRVIYTHLKNKWQSLTLSLFVKMLNGKK